MKAIALRHGRLQCRSLGRTLLEPIEGRMRTFALIRALIPEDETYAMTRKARIPMSPKQSHLELARSDLRSPLRWTFCIHCWTGYRHTDLSIVRVTAWFDIQRWIGIAVRRRSLTDPLECTQTRYLELDSMS